ncbi:MAG TPA: TIGR01777 family oxidoreductase [Thermodesulfobacteriota bacterium]|nr:TIGR01777 family oxidoreductase [Thermodesulfobacteriota bacterium]
MKIIIPGGSGQVGTLLARAFIKDGHDVTILSRNPELCEWRTVRWDGKTLGKLAEELEDADVVINMAGRSVNCRYNKENRDLIMNSRVDSTRVIGKAIANCKNPPRVWLQASTATIYEDSYDRPNDEFTGVIGGNEPHTPDTWKFSIDVATAWEKILDEADTPNTRKVKLRSAIILSPDRGGIFDTILQLVRFGLGGKVASGRQMMSWVHYKDFINAIYWIIENEDISDMINICSPNPLPNSEFMKELRKAWGIRIGLPASKLMIEIGTFFLRTESELVLKSRYVVPKILQDRGFEFQYQKWNEAAENLCMEWKNQNC